MPVSFANESPVENKALARPSYVRGDTGVWRRILAAMVTGAHFLLYTTDADADRAFFRDILGFRAVDAGHGWLIFGMPPAELAVHPGDGNFAQTHAGHSMLGALLYLMCDDLAATVAELAAKGVTCGEVDQAPWGTKTTVPLPSGGEIGLYQPRHPTAI